MPWNNRQKNHGERNGGRARLSLRSSVMVWVGGAVLGWAIMVVSVYQVLRFPHEQAAGPIESGALPLTASEEKALSDIAPAAGGDQSAASAPEDESATAPAEDEDDEDKDDEDDASDQDAAPKE